jgi:rsbT co-antagonist protein RsbR
MAQDEALQSASVKEMLLLKQRVAELEAELARQAHETAALRLYEERFRVLTERLPVGVFQMRFTRPFTCEFVNDRWCELTGVPREQANGAAWGERMHPEDRPAGLEAWQEGFRIRGPVYVEYRLRGADEQYRWVRVDALPVRGESGELEAYLGTVTDISERKRLEALLHETVAQKELIAAQKTRLGELSTPFIPLSEGIVVMPLVGEVDAERADQVLERLLAGVSQHDVRMAILDVTGVLTVDTLVATALLRAGQAGRLLGARVVLSGIRPEVAQTLARMDAQLGDMATFASLKAAIAYGLRAVRGS